jgi:general L-amino acid transport system substrate-binding protein
MGFNFTVATFFDGQAFLVPVSANLTSAVALDGKTICVQAGTTNEINVAEYAEAKRITLNQLVFPDPNEARLAFINGRCAAVTSDASQLAALRAADPLTADTYVILPERISKEPLGPLVRRGDEEWFAIVKWTIYALILAEERGIALQPHYDKDGYAQSQTVDQTAKDTNPEALSLIGVAPGMGKILGLSNDWAANVIRQVGNYGEIFERNVGPKTPLKLSRGLNALWSEGGLMYAMPVR